MCVDTWNGPSVVGSKNYMENQTTASVSGLHLLRATVNMHLYFESQNGLNFEQTVSIATNSQQDINQFQECLGCDIVLVYVAIAKVVRLSCVHVWGRENAHNKFRND